MKTLMLLNLCHDQAQGRSFSVISSLSLHRSQRFDVQLVATPLQLGQRGSLVQSGSFLSPRGHGTSVGEDGTQSDKLDELMTAVLLSRFRDKQDKIISSSWEQCLVT